MGDFGVGLALAETGRESLATIAAERIERRLSAANSNSLPGHISKAPASARIAGPRVSLAEFNPEQPIANGNYRACQRIA